MEIPKNHVARLIAEYPLRPYKHPQEGEILGYETLWTVRPGDSKNGPYEKALVGGIIEEGDLKRAIKETVYDDRFLSEELLIAAAWIAVLREVREELGDKIADLLENMGLVAQAIFVEKTEFGGYTTISFAVDLPFKPDVEAKANSAGTVSVNVTEIFKKPTFFAKISAKIFKRKPDFFADHQQMAQHGLVKLGATVE